MFKQQANMIIEHYFTVTFRFNLNRYMKLNDEILKFDNLYSMYFIVVSIFHWKWFSSCTMV